MRLANHLKECFGLLDAVNRKFGIKNLMTAMLGIGLRKHHQFDVRGIAFLSGKGIDQVVDFVFRKRQTHLGIGFLQSRATAR